MRIEDEKIVETFNRLYDAGHPDPAGFIARGEIKTGLDFDKEYKGSVGTFGVNEKQAKQLGYAREDLELTDTNLAAAIEIDMSNYRKADGDLDEMYRLSNPGSETSTNRFVQKLSRERDNLHNKFIYEDGRLTGFSQSSTEGDTTDSFTVRDKDSKLVYKETRRIKTPEDIKKQTNTFEFRQADRAQIDKLMVRLVNTIIDEKPING